MHKMEENNCLYFFHAQSAGLSGNFPLYLSAKRLLPKYIIYFQLSHI